MKEGIDYEYVIDEKDKASVHIKLLTGEYKDTVFKYGKVGFKEESPEKVYLQFAFDVISSPFKKLEKKEESGKTGNATTPRKGGNQKKGGKP